MLLSDIIKELEAKGHTEITLQTNKWGNFILGSIEPYSDTVCTFHAWDLVSDKLVLTGSQRFDTNENS